MNRLGTVEMRPLVVVLGLGFLGFVSAIRIIERNASPGVWLLVGVSATVTFLLTGPFAWGLRAHLSEKRRTDVGIAVTGVLFLVVLVLGVELPLRGLSHVPYALVLGASVGYTIVTIVEREAVPERLRSPENR